MKIKPRTMADFNRIGKKKLRGVTPRAACIKHNQRAAAELENVDRLATRQPGRPFAGRNVQLIRLGGHAIAPTAHPRARRWDADQPDYKTQVVTRDAYSGRWSATDYCQHIESWGITANGHLFAWIYDGEFRRKLRLAPWRGWTWKTDNNGIHLVSPNGEADHHPTAKELLARTTTAQFAAIARKNLALRRAAARQAAAELREMKQKTAQQQSIIRTAEREGLMVCLRDSVKAGNCLAGSQTWAERHGLDPQRHYAPTTILKLANGDLSRVSLVVASALRRHRSEMASGVCLLTDHVAN